MTKQYLRASLNMGMHGIQQMPVLNFKTPFIEADQINLSRYKILINEPLHDLSNHTNTIQEELSHHVPKENTCKKYYSYIIQWKRGTKFRRSQKKLADYYTLVY